MKASAEQVHAGQAVYGKQTLNVYDFVVLGVSNRFIWRCPTPKLLEHYDRHVSANHLDVGVGTGYYPDRCRFPERQPRVALMDLNPETLKFAAKRIARLTPETYEQNVLEPVTTDLEKFDSVAVNYLLHCLPGSMSSKSVVFDNLKQLMNPGAVLFGSTLLQGDVPRNWFAKRLMSVYNKKGIFSNTQDDLSGLTEALEKRFQDVEVTVLGCGALFSART